MNAGRIRLEPDVEGNANDRPLASEPQRTDPKSFAVSAIILVGQLVIPLAIALATIFDADDLELLLYAIPVALLVILLNVVLAYLRWWRFTYAVGQDDIRVESGLLSRAARSVPYERIQDVSLEQKLVPRLFGLVEVKFETGAGGKDELRLAYLTESEGERLRDLVRSQKDGATPAAFGETPAETAGDAKPLFAMGPGRVLKFGLFEFSLAIVAVIGGAAQQFEFLLPFEIWDVSYWREQFGGQGARLAGMGVAAQLVAALLGIVTLVILGVATGLIRTALREWDFRLERTDKGLRRRRGLLTRTDVVMPLHRVQALRIGTGIVRRRFGWHGLNVVSLAQDSGAANHSVAPFARMEEIAPLVETVEFHLPSAETDWQKGAIEYRIDRVVLAGLVMVPLAIGLLVAVSAALAVLPVFVLAGIAAIEAVNWRFAANALDSDQLHARRNRFAPRLSIAKRVKLQSAEISQGPIARRRGYATLHLGLAGGKFAIAGIPLARAKALRAAVLDSISQRDFSTLL